VQGLHQDDYRSGDVMATHGEMLGAILSLMDNTKLDILMTAAKGKLSRFHLVACS
jgi:hypothetical protein